MGRAVAIVGMGVLFVACVVFAVLNFSAGSYGLFGLMVGCAVVNLVNFILLSTW